MKIVIYLPWKKHENGISAMFRERVGQPFDFVAVVEHAEGYSVYVPKHLRSNIDSRFLLAQEEEQQKIVDNVLREKGAYLL